MRRGFKCRKEIIEDLRSHYDDIIAAKFNGNFLDALEKFDELAENDFRDILRRHYEGQRSRDQAWKTCKGALYEYAIFKYLQGMLEDDELLRERVTVKMGDDALDSHKEELAIRNWSDIFPDVDILIINKANNSVVAILSCKTSLRERLTETAFWKRELEKTRGTSEIKLFFVTTDKDNELRTETNRYILLHVVDYTFISNPCKYKELIEAFKKKYGDREDFYKLVEKIKFVGEMKEVLKKELS